MNVNGCGCGDFDGPQTLSTPSRNNYFYGKLLDEHHFRMEQSYYNTKRWMLNRLAVGEGVLCGLSLTAVNNLLVLAPGVAVDKIGREILVPVATVFDPRQLTDSCGKPVGPAAAGPVTIRLAYHPCPAEPMPVLVPDCDSATRCAAGTIRESFAILVTQGAPPVPPPPWPPLNFFDPPTVKSGDVKPPNLTLNDIMAEVVAHVDMACPQVPTCADSPVLLAQVTMPASATDALTDADVSFVGRQVLLSQAALFQMILALWERVEHCCAAMAGGGGTGGTGGGGTGGGGTGGGGTGGGTGGTWGGGKGGGGKGGPGDGGDCDGDKGRPGDGGKGGPGDGGKGGPGDGGEGGLGGGRGPKDSRAS